jgi:Protein of unknown function (DUF3047)
MTSFTLGRPSSTPRLWLLVLGLLCGLLVGCAGPRPSATTAAPAKDQITWNAQAQAAWQEVQLPGKTPTLYRLDEHAPGSAQGQRAALMAHAQSSASMLRAPVRIEPDALNRVSFSWFVPDLIADADMGQRDSDDSPVRLILAFEGDRNKFSAKDAMVNELARLLTGEEMPYATLMYVWCNKRPAESIIHSPRTDRIRKIVVESGAQGLKQWRAYERDIREDFVRAFGEAPGALVAIGLMSDSDNTRSNAVAWYGPVAMR